ncbi:VWA domain-containing protein [bacterium CPR1]|nr:VWA domain-containing protein [bacterium CPR1]
MSNACIDVAWSKGRERIPFEVADIGDLSSDFEVKLAVRTHLGARCPDLTDYAVLRASPTCYYLRVPVSLRLRRLVERLDAWYARQISPESALEVWLRQRLEPLGVMVRRWILAPLGRLTFLLLRLAWRLILKPLGRLTGLLLRLAGKPLGLMLKALGRVLVALGPPLQTLSTALNRILELLLFGPLSAVVRVLTRLASSPRMRRLRRRLGSRLELLRGWIFGVVERVWTGQTAEERERDHRLRLLESLLTTPHRRLDRLAGLHQQMARQDILFYVHLAAWYRQHGQVRDHQELFTAQLVLDSTYRDVGLALLRQLPPYQLARVLTEVKRRGKNPPRSLRTEIERYLRRREADPAAFDGAALAARKALKQLYTSLHIKPGPRAQAILFEDRPPEDSRLFALRELARERDPERQAALVRKHRLPYKVAAGLLVRHEATALALVEQMSPAELLNHMGTLKKNGWLALDPVAERVRSALEQAGSNRRVSALKVEKAARAAGEDWQALLDRILQKRLESNAGWITRSTALLVDASASMEPALELGKRLASMVAAVARGPLAVYTFARESTLVDPERRDYAGWAEAFEGLEARGQSSMGAALLTLYKSPRVFDQVILVSDQRENQSPRFLPALRLLRRRNRWLSFCFVNLDGGVHLLEADCRRLKVDLQTFNFQGDYYALPNLLPFLAQPSRMAMLMEILDTPLPGRS